MEPLGYSDTTVHAWGRYYDNTLGYVPIFVPVGMTDVVGLASGSDHIVALRRDGTVAAWGTCYFPWGFQPATVPAGLSNVVAVAAGEGQTLALRADGTVVAWNAYGYQAVPPEATNAVSIAAGGYGYGSEHNLVALADGSLVAWGNNASGQSTVPAGVSNVVSVSVGAAHSLALSGDGSVRAWGNNDFGQTNVPSGLNAVVEIAGGKVFANLALKADGTVVPWGEYYNGSTYVPMDVPGGLSEVVAVSAGNYHGLALQANGAVACWGYYHDGSNYLPLSTPLGVNDGVAIASGGNFAVVLSGPMAPFLNTPMLDQIAVVGSSPSFRVHATATRPFYFQWRRNGLVLPGETNHLLTLTNIALEQAGSYSLSISNTIGTTISPPATLTVVPLRIVDQPRDQTGIIGGNVSFTVLCESVLPLSYQWRFKGVDLPGSTDILLNLTGLTEDQAGDYSVIVSNSAGAVPSSNAVLAMVPLVITSQPASQAIVAGESARLSVGCQSFLPLSFQWRWNGFDLAGATANPLVLPGVAWSQKGRYSVVARNVAGAVESSEALLRVAARSTTIRTWGLTNAITSVPVGFTNVASLAAGMNHNLVLWSDGSTAAWGQNDSGQAAVPPQADYALAIAAGVDHSLALGIDGTVIAWGRNDQGQTAVPIGLTNVIALAAGAGHSLALLENGTVVAWGSNASGQTNVPAGLTSAVAIAAGTNCSLALREDGTVVAWGANNFGQTNVPAGLSNAVAISAGAGHCLALQADGNLAAWGSFYAGRTWVPATAPPGLTNVAAISAGLLHGLALKEDGTVFGWGWNGNGQTNVPAGLTNVVALAAGGFRSLAIVAEDGQPLRVRAQSPTLSNSVFAVELPTTSGRVYRLEYKNALEEIKWTALPLVAGSGKIRRLLDPGAGTARRFYRIREW